MHFDVKPTIVLSDLMTFHTFFIHIVQ